MITLPNQRNPVGHVQSISNMFWQRLFKKKCRSEGSSFFSRGLKIHVRGRICEEELLARTENTRERTFFGDFCFASSPKSLVFSSREEMCLCFSSRELGLTTRKQQFKLNQLVVKESSREGLMSSVVVATKNLSSHKHVAGRGPYPQAHDWSGRAKFHVSLSQGGDETEWSKALSTDQ